MANVKISQLPEYTGNTSGSWLVMNNSGESTTYKVERETLLSGYAPSGNYATTGSNTFNGNQTISGSVTTFNTFNNKSSTLVGGQLNITDSTFTNITALELGNLAFGNIPSGSFGNVSFLNNKLILSTTNSSIEMTGSIRTTGSLNVRGNTEITGSLTASGSYNVLRGNNGNAVVAGLGGINSIVANEGTSYNFIEALSGSNNLIAIENYLNGTLRVVGNSRLSGSVSITGSLNVTGNITATTSSVATSITTFDSTVGGNLNVANGYVRTPVILGQIGNTPTGTLDLLTLTRLSLTSSIGDVNISAGESAGTPKNIRLTSAGGTINSGSLRVIGNTTLTGSLNMTGSLTVRHTSLGTTSITGNTIDTTNGSVIAQVFASNDQANLFAGGTNNDVQILAAGTGSISLNSRTRINGNTTITGSVNISAVMNLAKQNPLPTGTTGSLAVSGSGLYFHNGTSWTLIS